MQNCPAMEVLIANGANLQVKLGHIFEKTLIRSL